MAPTNMVYPAVSFMFGEQSENSDVYGNYVPLNSLQLTSSDNQPTRTLTSEYNQQQNNAYDGNLVSNDNLSNNKKMNSEFS